MTRAPTDVGASTAHAAADSLLASADAIDKQTAGMVDRLGDPAFTEALTADLRQLHARLRGHTAGAIRAKDQGLEIPPELVPDSKRLREETTVILGRLDRIMRATESIADRTLEDKEVFKLQLRELVATLRRHVAEEDRVFYISLWRDTGGES